MGKQIARFGGTVIFVPNLGGEVRRKTHNPADCVSEIADRGCQLILDNHSCRCAGDFRKVATIIQIGAQPFQKTRQSQHIPGPCKTIPGSSLESDTLTEKQIIESVSQAVFMKRFRTVEYVLHSAIHGFRFLQRQRHIQRGSLMHTEIPTDGPATKYPVEPDMQKIFADVPVDLLAVAEESFSFFGLSDGFGLSADLILERRKDLANCIIAFGELCDGFRFPDTVQDLARVTR